MSVFKCKMCGGDLVIEQGSTVAECEYCGSKQTLPKLDSERKANLYDRANHFRRNNDYDKAMGIYEQILNEDDSDAEAYWSLVLCRYGIEYVEDPSTRRRVPTVNRAQFTSIYSDEDYKAALAHSDALQKSVYEAEAKAIDDIHKGILAISSKEEPFDVFICYKETDESGRRTQDSVLANELYHQLTQEGFKVFFSRITLEDKLGQEYEPYIFAALNSAKVMVVLGTKPEYFKAVWVKNEWSRFLALVRQSGGKKVLIPAYKNMDPYDLPEEFSHLQAQDMGKLGFMQDLIRGIKKLTEKDEKIKQPVQTIQNVPGVESLLKRAQIFLSESEWDSASEYFNKVLDIDPERSAAYIGLMLVAAKRNSKEAFESDYVNGIIPSGKEIERAARFADEGTAKWLTEIKTRRLLVEEERKRVEEKERIAAEETRRKAEEEYRRAENERRLALEAEANKKAEQIAAALRKGSETSGASLEEQYASARTRVEYISRIVNVFAETQEEISQLKSEINSICSQEENLSVKRSNLGLFAGKEKKRIDEELTVLASKKKDMTAQVGLLEQKLNGYSSLADAEKDLDIARDSVSRIEAKLETERACGNKTYSFDDAWMIYRSDPVLKVKVDSIYPPASFSYAFSGKTDSVFFGKCIQRLNGIPEPIEWQVLEKKEDCMLLISKCALIRREYNTDFTEVVWETCSLRSWLNSEFMNNIFSPMEQALISTHQNDDKVFILSISEANKFFPTDKEKICKATEYCRSMGVLKDNRCNCWWWLRSDGSSSKTTGIVQPNGAIMRNGRVNSEFNGVRPAIWVKRNG